MKATYRCDFCDFTTDNLEAVNAHEAAHKEVEALENKINALIDEYNTKHKDDKFFLAHYKPNSAVKKPAPKPKDNGVKTKPPLPADKAINYKDAELTPLEAFLLLGAMMEALKE